jgi:hypothetical protein
VLGVEALEEADESSECREAAGCLPLRRGMAIALDDDDMVLAVRQVGSVTPAKRQ